MEGGDDGVKCSENWRKAVAQKTSTNALHTLGRRGLWDQGPWWKPPLLRHSSHAQWQGRFCRQGTGSSPRKRQEPVSSRRTFLPTTAGPRDSCLGLTAQGWSPLEKGKKRRGSHHFYIYSKCPNTVSLPVIGVMPFVCVKCAGFTEGLCLRASCR